MVRNRTEEKTLPLFTEGETPLLMLMDGHAMVHRSFRAISTQRHLTVSATGFNPVLLKTGLNPVGLGIDPLAATL